MRKVTAKVRDLRNQSAHKLEAFLEECLPGIVGGRGGGGRGRGRRLGAAHFLYYFFSFISNFYFFDFLFFFRETLEWSCREKQTFETSEV